VAAEIAISNQCITVIRALDSDSSDQQVVWSRLAELEAIATAANHLHCQLNTLEVKQTLEKLILRTLWQILYDSNPEEVEVDIQRLDKMIDVGNQLNLSLSLDRCQELYLQYFHNQILPQLIQSQDLKKDSQNKDSDSNGSYPWLCKMCTCSTALSASLSPSPLLKLGQTLAVDLSGWVTNLPSPG
ncbi:MAG: glycoside hydrolase, partial [Moorea sp. SIO3I6]|nr:glycoside hydrolase [Moorena sp. SIO3I6]